MEHTWPSALGTAIEAARSRLKTPTSSPAASVSTISCPPNVADRRESKTTLVAISPVSAIMRAMAALAQSDNSSSRFAHAAAGNTAAFSRDRLGRSHTPDFVELRLISRKCFVGYPGSVEFGCRNEASQAAQPFASAPRSGSQCPFNAFHFRRLAASSALIDSRSPDRQFEAVRVDANAAPRNPQRRVLQ